MNAPEDRNDRADDRVRRHTDETVLDMIEARTRENIREHGAHAGDIGGRIAKLEREWDIEQTLEASASTLALTGAVLGTTVNKKWFWLTGGVLGFLFQHAISGWCPPLPILRKLGFRTQAEIDQEKYALKAIRGDMDQARGKEADRAVDAVTKSEHSATEGRRDPDRVRRYTSNEQLRKIDDAIAQRVRLYATQPSRVISERIKELTREWSIERYLQINVAAVGLTTAALAVGKDRRWGIATCAGLAFFLFHAVEGFDTPLPLMRKAGLRSRAEIDREIYALKILRGDFDEVFESDHEAGRVEAALAAVGA
jgi:hypothetical protein